MNISLLPLSSAYGAIAALLAIAIIAWKHRTDDAPAQSANDYIPIFYVTAATVCLLYMFLFLQSATAFLEKSRLTKEYNVIKSNEKEKPTMVKVKYGTLSEEVIAANRCVGNLLEQIIPFLVSLYAYATFVSVAGAAKFGWVWIICRSYYGQVFRKPFPALFSSTVPAYYCVWYMLGRSVYEAAKSA